MRRILNTISADININAEVYIMDIDSKIELRTILKEEVNYEDWDALLDRADRVLRLVAKYIYKNEGLVASVETVELEKTNNIIPENYEVIIDLDPYMVKYMIDILEMYRNNVVVFDDDNWMSEDEEEYASILPNIIVYVPIYNTHKNVIKNIVCINNI